MFQKPLPSPEVDQIEKIVPLVMDKKVVIIVLGKLLFQPLFRENN